jgi:hypothetical protein
LKIDKKRVATIPDVKTTDGKYNFTDGVGQISSKLNILVSDTLFHPKQTSLLYLI